MRTWHKLPKIIFLQENFSHNCRGGGGGGDYRKMCANIGVYFYITYL